MSVITCPSCGKPVEVPEKKTGLWWGIGCLIAAIGLPVIIAIGGLLAAIAIPSFVKARLVSQKNACVNNMRAIESAKQALAAADGLSAGQTVAEEQLAPHLPARSGGIRCPVGGTYTAGLIGEEPECSIHGSMSDPREQQGQRRATPGPGYR